jgi:hypothetical protein
MRRQNWISLVTVVICPFESCRCSTYHAHSQAQQIMFAVAAVVTKPNRYFPMKGNIIYHLDAHNDALRAAHSSLNISDGVTGGIGTSPRLLQTLDSLSADNAFTFARFCSSR